MNLITRLITLVGALIFILFGFIWLVMFGWGAGNSSGSGTDVLAGTYDTLSLLTLGIIPGLSLIYLGTYKLFFSKESGSTYATNKTQQSD